MMGRPWLTLALMVALVGILIATKPSADSFAEYAMTVYSEAHDTEGAHAPIRPLWPLAPDWSFNSGVPAPCALRTFNLGLVTLSVAASPHKAHYTHWFLGAATTHFALPYFPRVGRGRRKGPSPNSKSSDFGLGVCVHGTCLCVPGRAGAGKSCYKVVWHEGNMYFIMVGLTAVLSLLWLWPSYVGVLHKHCTLTLSALGQRRWHVLLLAPFAHQSIMFAGTSMALFTSLSGMFEHSILTEATPPVLERELWLLVVYLAGAWAAFAGALCCHCLLWAVDGGGEDEWDRGISLDMVLRRVVHSGSRDALSALLGFLHASNPQLTFTLRPFFLPLALTVTPAKGCLAHFLIDWLLSGGRGRGVLEGRVAFPLVGATLLAFIAGTYAHAAFRAWATTLELC